MCTYPLKGFKYGKTDNGKDNYIIRPYNVNHIEVDSSGHVYDCPTFDSLERGYEVIYDYIEIPCGKCLECRLNYARVWSTRCYLESMQHDKNAFITLTYDDDHIPMETKHDIMTGEIKDLMTLRKRDWQLFMKKFRKVVSDPIRFYACGEYSPKGRPHYHAIIFGWYPDDDELLPVKKNNLGQTLYTNKLLADTWENGMVTVGEVTPQSCGYVARYVSKKVNADYDDLIEKMGIEKEFVLMSRKPGIGRSWIDEHKSCYSTNLRNYEAGSDGSIMITPNRYFDGVIEKEDPIWYFNIKEKRKEFAQEKKKLLLEQTSLDYWDTLKVHENGLKNRTAILEETRKENL